MSNFKVEVLPVIIEPHPNADRIEIAKIGDYQSIVQKGQFKTGDLVAYIPENTIVPDNILEEMGLTGKLCGKRKNRVRPIKLRQVLSQGLCYPIRDGWVEGQDIADELGIIKYEAPLPVQMKGEVYSCPELAIKYDIENFKRYPDVLVEGEEVVITEKIHGTFMCIIVLPDDNRYAHEEHYQGKFAVCSKGLGSKGIFYKHNEKNIKSNVYIRAFHELELSNKLKAFLPHSTYAWPAYVLGEVHGYKVQDLQYGFDTDKLGFRVFDIISSGIGYIDYAYTRRTCDVYHLEHVPVLYKGPFSKDILLQHTDGAETVSGNTVHIKEGVVVKPIVERTDDELGRVILKSVSEDYLLRKGGSEYN